MAITEHWLIFNMDMNGGTEVSLSLSATEFKTAGVYDD